MTRLSPIPREDLPEREPVFELVEASMGFVPTSMRVMAKWPALFDAFAGLSATVMAMGPLAPELRHLVAHVASTAAGCRYCQAHTAAHGIESGTDAKRYEDVWEFGTSDLFTDAERALLRFAFRSAQQPSAVEDGDVTELERHWSEEEIIHALAVVSVFGYLNRFNGALATTLEPEPLAIAEQHLTDSGWTPEAHAKTER
ncbi:MAG TPA: carboxymuconolactone decarboxylase family protein [Acidimicrobiia bacterium]|nr:carboxymuconolactone decarboxylase family protein [Acidimicrobiia bacterium]